MNAVCKALIGLAMLVVGTQYDGTPRLSCTMPRNGSVRDICRPFAPMPMRAMRQPSSKLGRGYPSPHPGRTGRSRRPVLRWPQGWASGQGKKQ